MGLGVIAVVADIVVSAAVSKIVSEVVTSVATGLGASEKTAGLLGGIAGIVGGSYAYGSGSSALGMTKGGEAMAAAGAAETAAATEQVMTQGQMLASQTGDIAGGAELTRQALATGGTPAMNASIMADYAGAAPSAAALADAGALEADIARKSTGQYMDVGADSAGVATKEGLLRGGETVVTQPEAAAAVQGVAGAVPGAPEATWYEKLWDKSGGELVGGIVKGASSALLSANADEADYERRRRDEVADRWTGSEKFTGLRPGDFGNKYDPTYVSREEQGLLTAGAS